ncbi:hypothetical protein F511_16179 [Dorcoceras hygrometricum]|uniref:Uncharacterized protein n=1 Tax=Dorcoceras hygrometricum TaxID=472368 RepID=A0A2Z7ATT6_9LAMI|nr:hypothetical protein F511_16179 [Dorcoceras hygrometricum]
MGRPGQARTKPRRKLAVATMPKHRRTCGRRRQCSARHNAARGIASSRDVWSMPVGVAPDYGATDCAMACWPSSDEHATICAASARRSGRPMAQQAPGSNQKSQGKSGSSRICVTLNGSGIQLAVGPQPLRLRNHNFGLAHRIMVKILETSPHDPRGSSGNQAGPGGVPAGRSPFP